MLEERVCLKKDLGPDQENNVRDMKKFLENNNDALAANFEKKHYCDLDDVKMMTQNIERKPPEKVIFNDHHEVLRGTKILNIKQNLFVPDLRNQVSCWRHGLQVQTVCIRGQRVAQVSCLLMSSNDVWWPATSRRIRRREKLA